MYGLKPGASERIRGEFMPIASNVRTDSDRAGCHNPLEEIANDFPESTDGDRAIK